jgi:YD repeat-containing protein
MNQRFTCPHGHQWEADPQSTHSAGTDASECPYCKTQSAPSPKQNGPAATDDSTRATPLDVSATLGGPTVRAPADWPDLEGFTFLSKVGEGGMGIVFKARQQSLKRVVAVKTIRAGVHASADALARFRIEAEAVAQIAHENIVHIYEIGEKDGRPYFSMEFVGGGNLAELLREKPMTDGDAAKLLLTLSRAMQTAHERGIIHRDLKPGNVLLTASGAPKIADFGLAKRMEVESALTRTTDRLGTPAYMAPEQAAGEHTKVGPATDVYALGMILYECLAGCLPFTGDNPHSITRAVIETDPVSPSYYRPSIPVDLETICLKCLRKEPRERYSNAGELAEDLRRFLAGDPILGRRPSWFSRVRRWARRHGTAATALGLSAVVILAATACVIYANGYLLDKVSYYRNLNSRWAIPEGIGRIDAEQVRRRAVSCRFHRRGWWGPVQGVEIINAFGTLTVEHGVELILPEIRSKLPGGNTECEYRIEYEGGRVAAQVGVGVTGRPLWRFVLVYPPDDTSSTPLRCRGRFETADGEMLSTDTGIASVEFIRRPDGFEEKLLFFDADNRPAANSRGVFGLLLEHDRTGLVTQIQFLDENQAPMATSDGVMRQLRSWSDQGELFEESYFDGTKNPVVNSQGIHKGVQKYDPYGNRVSLEYFGITENKVEDENGNHHMSWHYENGLLVKEVWSGAKGETTIETLYERNAEGRIHSTIMKLPTGDGFEQVWRTDFNEEGHQERQSVEGTLSGYVRSSQGAPQVGASVPGMAGGKTVTEWSYNPSGLASRRTVTSPDGTTTSTEWEYDARGRTTKETRFQNGVKTGWTEWASGHFGPLVEGVYEVEKGEVSRKTWEYDIRGRKSVESQYLTGSEEKDGAIRWEYDRHGRVTAEHTFGTKGLIHEKTVESVYDSSGRELSRTEYAADAVTIVDRLTWRYNRQGLLEEQTHQGPGGTEDFSRETWTYDEKGNPATKVEWSGTAPTPYHTTRWAYDADGNERLEEHLGPMNTPVAGPNGYVKLETEYEGSTYKTQIFSGYDPGALGFSRRVVRRLEGGAKIMTEYQDDQGQPVRHPDGNTTWTREYDSQGRPLREIYSGYDESQGLAPVMIVELNSSGQESVRYYQTSGGQPARSTTGEERVESAYKNGALWRRVFSGYDSAQGYAPVMIVEFDSAGRPVKKTFETDDHHSTRGPSGEKQIDIEYHPEGWMLREIHSGYDPSLGLPFRMISTFDEHGRVTSKAYQSKDGTPAAGPDAIHRITYDYDSQGRTAEEAYWDVALNPQRLAEGHSRATAEHRPDGSVASTYWGFDDSYGYAASRRTRTASGALLEIAYLDQEGLPVNTPAGFSRAEFQLDGDGIATSASAYDAGGAPVSGRMALRVLSVDSSGVGADKGLQPGDVLLSYDGRAVFNQESLTLIRQAAESRGDDVVIQVERQGRPLDPIPVPATLLGIIVESVIVPPDRPDS